MTRQAVKNVYEIGRSERRHFPRKVERCLTNLGVEVTAYNLLDIVLCGRLSQS
jgi:hypothetical protein